MLMLLALLLALMFIAHSTATGLIALSFRDGVDGNDLADPAIGLGDGECDALLLPPTAQLLALVTAARFLSLSLLNWGGGGGGTNVLFCVPYTAQYGIDSGLSLPLN